MLSQWRMCRSRPLHGSMSKPTSKDIRPTRLLIQASLPARRQRFCILQGLIGRALAGRSICVRGCGTRPHHLLDSPMDAADLQTVPRVFLLLTERSSSCRLLHCILCLDADTHSACLFSKHLEEHCCLCCSCPKCMKQLTRDLACLYLGTGLLLSAGYSTEDCSTMQAASCYHESLQISL